MKKKNGGVTNATKTDWMKFDMLESTLNWIEGVNEDFSIMPKRVLDVGSREQKDRSGARDLFPNSEYIGIDLEPGPNVDMVVDAYWLGGYFGNNYFDAILCLHVLEHLARPWIVVGWTRNVLRSNGHLYISVPTIGYPVHNAPGDFWRPTEQAVREVFMDGYEVLSLEHAESPRGKHPFINCLGVKK